MNPVSFAPVAAAGPMSGLTPPAMQARLARPISPDEFPGQGVGGLTGPAAVPESSFDSILGRLVNEVNTRQWNAGEAVRGVASGDQVQLHEAVIAMEEASVSFQLMVEVRNKLLESYQELMRMQV
jgi:flagellar hook-basal body complex protein FliE